MRAWRLGRGAVLGRGIFLVRLRLYPNVFYKYIHNKPINQYYRSSEQVS